MKFLLKLAITALGVWIAFSIVPGLDFDGSFWNLLLVAVLVALVNGIVKPIMNLLSLPIVILTLGLFLLITNALALQLVIWLSGPERLDLGITSTGFFWATFLGALVISVVRFIAERLIDVD
ncbi:MAG: phage holin family protein [Acidimicrobiia bacterium]